MRSRIRAGLRSLLAHDQFPNSTSCSYRSGCNHVAQFAQRHEARGAGRFFQPLDQQTVISGAASYSASSTIVFRVLPVEPQACPVT